MTVRELIEHLEQFEDDELIVVGDNEKFDIGECVLEEAIRVECAFVHGSDDTFVAILSDVEKSKEPKFDITATGEKQYKMF